MQIRTFIVDSFTREPFRGNPAAVCLLPETIDDDTIGLIAREFGLSETAFVLGNRIRFFSPKMEIPLCGHATLAAAKVLFDGPEVTSLSLTTGSGVTIPITKSESGGIAFGFPIEELQDATIAEEALDAIGISEIRTVKRAEKTPVILVEIGECGELCRLTPEFGRLEKACVGINGIVVTAHDGDRYDYQLRYFWPWSGTNEDPVTGGVQRFVAPFWAEKLGKTKLHSYQCSPRGGEMEIQLRENQVVISGEATIVLKGNLKL